MVKKYLLLSLTTVVLLSACAVFEPSDYVGPYRHRTIYDELLLTKLAPGMSLTDAQSMIEKAHIRGATRLSENVIAYYSTVMLDAFYQNQHLVLVHDGRDIMKVALIIEFEDVGNLDTPEQFFMKILAKLSRRYGRPDFFYERGGPGGRFPADFAMQVNNTQFARSYQWYLPKGILRFGIPRRLDGRVRMEIQFSRPEDIAAFGNTLWSAPVPF